MTTERIGGVEAVDRTLTPHMPPQFIKEREVETQIIFHANAKSNSLPLSLTHQPHWHHCIGHDARGITTERSGGVEAVEGGTEGRRTQGGEVFLQLRKCDFYAVFTVFGYCCVLQYLGDRARVTSYQTLSALPVWASRWS